VSDRGGKGGRSQDCYEPHTHTHVCLPACLPPQLLSVITIALRPHQVHDDQSQIECHSRCNDALSEGRGGAGESTDCRLSSDLGSTLHSRSVISRSCLHHPPHQHARAVILNNAVLASHCSHINVNHSRIAYSFVRRRFDDTFYQRRLSRARSSVSRLLSIYQSNHDNPTVLRARVDVQGGRGSTPPAGSQFRAASLFQIRF